MITNERQLLIARAAIERFSASLDAMEAGSIADSGFDPAMQAAQQEAVRSEIAILQREVDDYQVLRSGIVTEFELRSLAELPDILIQARIATGLTQRELAERLGLKEQQVQRYEATRYEGASFARVADVADAVGLKIDRRLELLRATSAEALVKRLALLGVDEIFIRRRLAPRLGTSAQSVGELLDRANAIFGWEPGQPEATALAPDGAGTALARFKMPRRRNARGAAVYTAYAYHLACICADAMAARRRVAIPVEWRGFRDALLARYASLNLKTALSFAWDLGVVVLPLRDPGGFHGACWRIKGVNVIVLKQTTSFASRWLFDLLHELLHAGQDPERDEFEWIEESEMSDGRRSSPEEQHAMWFAGQVGLAGRAEELVALALKRANNGYLPKLKGAVAAVASEENVSVGFLANYLAFRLSMSGDDWWGAATNLQELSDDPYQLARDCFFDRFDFSNLDETSLELLTLALDNEVRDGQAS